MWQLLHRFPLGYSGPNRIWWTPNYMMLRTSLFAVLASGVSFLVALHTGPAFALDNTKYCNAVQNRNGFIRYPLGAIVVWSTPAGEMADVITRVPRVYPCLNSVVVKPEKEDWRASITGDPPELTIKYRADQTRGATTPTITP